MLRISVEDDAAQRCGLWVGVADGAAWVLCLLRVSFIKVFSQAGFPAGPENQLQLTVCTCYVHLLTPTSTLDCSQLGKRYSCAKAALHALAMNLAVHYGPDGINANAVAIGTVASPAIWEGALENDGDILKKIGSRIPRRTVGSPDEAAAVLTFLASPDAALINGTVIVADGGWTIAAGTSHDGPGSWFDA